MVHIVTESNAYVDLHLAITGWKKYSGFMVPPASHLEIGQHTWEIEESMLQK